MSTKGRDVRFSHEEGVYHVDNLTSGFSQSEGGSLVEILASIARVFEVYDSHAYYLMITLYVLFVSFP